MIFPNQFARPQRSAAQESRKQIAQRYSLDFAPTSSTEVNSERLPSKDQLREMELAFREEPQSEPDLRREVRLQILFFAIAGSLGAFLVHLIGSVIPFVGAFIFSLVVGLLAAVALFLFPRQRSVKRIIAALFLPPTFIILTSLLSNFLSLRPVASLILGILAIVCMYILRTKAHPIYFYQEWLFTAPNLKPETRRQRRNIIRGSATSTAQRRGWIIARGLLRISIGGAILFLVVVVPAYSPILAIFLLFLFSLFLTDFRPLRTYRLAEAVLAHHLTYGRNTSGAAGVWIPERSARSRRIAIASAVFGFYLALSTGLCLYFPAELVAFEAHVARTAEQPEKKSPPKDKQAQPEVSKRTPEAIAKGFDTYFDLDNVLESYRRDETDGKTKLIYRMTFDRNRNTHEQVNSLFAGMWKTLSLNLPIALIFFVIPFLFAITIPNLVILGMFHHILRRCQNLREKVEGLDRDGRVRWQWHVDRLTQSSHVAQDPLGNTVREAEHIFLGTEPVLQFPVLIDKRIVNEHVYMVGQSGSGKTSLGIMPLLIQLMRGQAPKESGTEFPRSVGNAAPPLTPIVIIDLKGDPALFHTARIEAERRGQSFKFFTPEKAKATHYFNPFRGFESSSRSLMQLCNLFLDSLNLNHGEGYGRSYYSRQSRFLLFEALNHSSKPRTFPELYNTILKLSTRYKDCFELLSTIHSLTFYDQLVTSPEQAIDASDVIHMPTLLEKRQVAYFWLPAAIESISVREIGKLALFCLLSAAIDRQRGDGPEQKKVRQVYLFIDEFQRIAGENFSIILEQARSFGISAILANQSISDLNTKDHDLRPTVRTNTRLQLHFSVSDPSEVKMLSEMSGREIGVLRSWARGQSIAKGFSRQSSDTVTWTEQFKNRLMPNDIARVSDHPLQMIAHVMRGSGYTQFAGLPFPVETCWPISEKEYRERQEAPWPTAAPIVSAKSPKETDQEARQGVAAMMDEDLLKVIREVRERYY